MFIFSPCESAQCHTATTMPEKLKFAIVCSSNMNRSMEAHSFLSKKGFWVRSFGIGNLVKLPGASPDKPNLYDFNTTYADIYKDLVVKDRQLYTQNGILNMLDRNRRIKNKPERFQECREAFDVVICCEERVFDQVFEGIIFLPTFLGIHTA
ncbi:unnamed protein product [Soboliphyme baturini]|uniref:RNA polymerase II subunit A C-terminal domain phosphatase SSU72 n=1 Tax=Soboliphyme baturini TaxID=241478 RepID=A0A183IQE4_9BILA|nr:unnamed protein product [Soboliphyme baturini]